MAWLRKVVQRMPVQFREQKLGRMAWALAFNTDGQVVHDLQDPSGRYGPVTSVTETTGRLFFGQYRYGGHRMGADAVDPADARARKNPRSPNLISHKATSGQREFPSAFSA